MSDGVQDHKMFCQIYRKLWFGHMRCLLFRLRFSHLFEDNKWDIMYLLAQPRVQEAYLG